MDSPVIEAQYPLSFRQEDAKRLGQHLKNRHSVVIWGMKRVGISNFLRFFLHNKDIVSVYIEGENPPASQDKLAKSLRAGHLFITVDLNDLVEREISPFWTLTLKRIEDAVAASNLPEQVKKNVEQFFLDSIQSQDLFLTIDRVRKALLRLIDANVLPTIFFIRFDRLKDAVTHEFFDNLQGLNEATHDKLAYVFTSFRGLHAISPTVFNKAAVSVFAQEMYIKPAKHEDMEIIYQTYKDKYKLLLKKEVEQALFDNVDGYVQYLQYALIGMHEAKNVPATKAELFERLVSDERISLQSEELWESLDSFEKEVLLKVQKGQAVTEEEKSKARYLWDTGLVPIFSPLFEYYLKQREKNNTSHGLQHSEFTKKELALFNVLKENLNQICEREKIIEKVWAEVEELGVSDWAIDRLVARVRSKLRIQNSPYELQTIKTRGYKLIENHS